MLQNLFNSFIFARKQHWSRTVYFSISPLLHNVSVKWLDDVCMYLLIGKRQSAQNDHIGAKIEWREKVMSKHMSLIVVWICAALLPMRLRVANGSSYWQSRTQNCFVFCGFFRFGEAVLLMIFLVLAFWRTWAIELHPDLYGCEVFCVSEPNHFVAFFFLGAAILGLDVVLHKWGL